jgi:hypothetical protein
LRIIWEIGRIRRVEMTKGSILKAIREHCLDCVGGNCAEVKNCTGEKMCKLFPFKFGKDPKPSRERQKIGNKLQYRLQENGLESTISLKVGV